MSPRDDYHGYPTGMGGRISITRAEFSEKATHLVELSEDWVDKIDMEEALFSMIIRLRKSVIGLPIPPPDDVEKDWAKLEGGASCTSTLMGLTPLTSPSRSIC